MNQKSVYLIGFMASGKTSIGKRLAAHLAMDFLDLDAKIEEKYGINISDFFAQKGEAAFRELESQTLKETIHSQTRIIACGGGTPCFNNNMQWINENGISVYLKLSPKHLFKRLRNKVEKRPLVAKLSVEDLQVFINQKLNERSSFYEQANFIVKRKNEDKKKDIAKHIVRILRQEHLI